MLRKLSLLILVALALGAIGCNSDASVQGNETPTEAQAADGKGMSAPGAMAAPPGTPTGTP